MPICWGFWADDLNFPPGVDGRPHPVRTAMIELFPRSPGEAVDVLAAISAEHRPAPAGRPWVMTNMIASSDGAITVGGLSGGLGSPADTEVFMALRSVSDAIVVGAATARQERYRPPGGSERVRARRAGRGQAPRPLLVVVTASLLLDGDLPMFSEAGYRPLIATVEAAPADRRATLSAVADVISVGADRVDLGQLMGELAGRGMQAVLVEGGPSLNAQLIAAELIDEWNLTLAPILVGAGPERAAAGPDLAHPITPMNLSRVWQEDDLLFCRWVRPAGEHGEAARSS